MDDLKHYFETTRGMGILATARSDGAVNAAVYSRPRVMEDGTVALIMADRRSHTYLSSNPHASYLFREDPGQARESRYRGIRLALTRTAEETGTERLQQMRRHQGRRDDVKRFLVFFRVDEVRPLVGDG